MMSRAFRWLFFVVALASAAIAYGQSIPQRARDQIGALLQEKASRTPVQQKIASDLLYARKMKHGLPIAVGIDQLEVSLETDAGGRVLVDITAGFSKDLINAIEAAGGTIVYAAKNAQSIRAWLPLDNVEPIAARKDLKFIQPAIPAMTQDAGDRKLHARALAANISEGVVAHRVDLARATYGASGAGVKIGVMSDSVDHLAAVQASGDLPNVTVLPGQSGTGLGNSGEGTAMLEIVHDVAPDAQLYFATAFNDVGSDFATNIIALRNAGCDIIVDDVFYFNESPFQDGPIAQAVNTVTAAGALYFSSAGNEGNVRKGTAGVWEGDFLDSGTTLMGGQVHSFGLANSDHITSASNNPVTLFWSDPLGASSNDYDLFFINSMGMVVGASTTTQNGTQDPFELINNGNNTKFVVITKSPAAAARFLHVTSIRGTLAIFTNGQTKGHSCAADAYGVAAADAAHPPGPFSGASPAETFTSDGPRKMFYNADGTLMNPLGGLLASGGAVRNKPDITAADGVSCATPGFNPFYGTSAAAPHAAAIAGLMKQMVPSATAAQIKSALTTTATDIENAGYDITTGFGIVNANAALAALGAVAQPFITLGTVTATPTIGNAAIDPGDNVNLTIALSNGGGAAATVVQGVLTSTSPDVTINAATEPYPTIAASGSATNTVPFNFTVSPSAVCGSPIPFVLTVTFAQSAVPRVFKFNVATGGSGTPMTFSFTGPPAAIPDNNPTGVSVPLSVSGVPASIKKIQFRIDGSSCNTNPASPTVGIDHTWVGDLVIDLISPTGTTVNLINSLTNGGDNNSGNNFCNTLLDDSASTPVQGLITSQAPFTGTFSPASPLSQFAGETANGTWTLHVVDVALQDTGNVRAWSLVITPAACSPILTVSPPTLPNGLRDNPYNQTITASGGSAPYSFFVTAGALPPGLTLSTAGALSGTPSASGPFSFTITAVDANGAVGSRAYSINVAAAGITSFTPNHGNTNTRVLLSGAGFTGATGVTFNGMAASSFTVLSDTQVRAIVPAGATTGLVGMTIPSGTISSVTNFTIVAQSNRTFVSSAGADANPCSPTMPCRAFTRALDATLYGGDIVVMDSAGYGTMTIDKSVTITAPDGVIGGVTATGTTGITINATPGDVIALRGLTLNGVSGATNGMQISNGAAVQLNNIVINGFATAINATGAERVHVYDSLIRGSTISGITVFTGSGTTFVLVDQTRLEANVQGISAGEGARVVVRRSQIVGTGSVGGGVLASGVSSSEVTLERVSITNTGMALQAAVSAQCIIRVSRSTITGNLVGVSMTGGASVASLGNNTLEGNGTDGTFNPLTVK